MTTDYRQPEENQSVPTETVPSGPLPWAREGGYLQRVVRRQVQDTIDCLIKQAVMNAAERKQSVRRRIRDLKRFGVRGHNNGAKHLWLFYERSKQQHALWTERVRLLHLARSSV